MAEPVSGQIENGSMDDESRENDPRLAFIYQEALRGLVQQQALVENLNNRAGSLIFATAFASRCSAEPHWQTGWGRGSGSR